MRPRAAAAVGSFILGAALLVGCSCEFDSGKLDELACSKTADCTLGRDCVEGLCVQRACLQNADCGDMDLLECDDGWCVARSGSDAGIGGDAGSDGGPDADGGSCAEGTECEDGDPCTSGDRCLDGACVGTPYSCEDGLDCTTGSCDGTGGCNSSVEEGSCAIEGVCRRYGARKPGDQCLGCVPVADPSAWTALDGWGCDDGNPCTFEDGCEGATCVATAYSCDDGVPCTLDECDGLGGCQSSLVEGHCLIDGACRLEGELNLNPCEECDPGVNPHGWTFDPANRPDDGIACTVDDCSSGTPVHVPDDLFCDDGQACAVCAGGCATMPSLSVSCPLGWHLPGQTSCTIDAGGLAGQAACLSCKSSVGISDLVRVDFTGCDLDNSGLTVTEIMPHFVDPQPECPAVPELGPDVRAFEDQLQFRSNSVTAITTFVNTIGYDSVRACFDLADARMDADDEIVVILTFDPELPVPQWTPVASLGEPVPGADFNWTRRCVDLGAGSGNDAEDKASVGIGLRVTVQHSPSGLFTMAFVDNISVEAWRSAYLTHPGPVAAIDFTGCPVDLGGWNAGGVDPPVCPATAGALAGRDLLEALDSQWTLTRTLDLSDRCGQIEVGFEHGTRGADPEDQTILTWDYGAGQSSLWASSRSTGPDETTNPFRMSLSAVDPWVVFQPAVTLRFDVRSYEAPEADGVLDGIFLDDVWIDGARCERDDGAIFTVDPPVEQDGVYEVPVSTAVQAAAWVECYWDGRARSGARDYLLFSDWGS